MQVQQLREPLDSHDQEFRDQVTLGERVLGATYYGTVGAVAGGGIAAFMAIAGGFGEMYSNLVGGSFANPQLAFAIPMTLLGAAGAAFGATKGISLQG